MPKSRIELFRQPLLKKKKREKNQQTLTEATDSYNNVNINCENIPIVNWKVPMFV